jgi:hypothetical protein
MPTPRTDGMCDDDAKLGDVRMLTDDSAKKYCVCGPDRTLLCAKDPNGCNVQLTEAACAKMSTSCCWRTLLEIGSSVCLESTNSLCKAPQKTPPGQPGNGTDGTGVDGGSGGTSSAGEEVISIAPRSASVVGAAVAAVAANIF